MPRIPYPDLAKLPKGCASGSATIRPTSPACWPRASEPVWTAFTPSARPSSAARRCPPKLREIAILRVGYLSNAAYEVFQHEALARHVGLSDDQIAAIKAGGAAAAALGEAGAAVLAYTDDLVNNVRASDETMAAVRKHLDDTQFVDLTLVIGMYMMVSRFLETTGIEIDSAPIDWKEVVPAEA